MRPHRRRRILVGNFQYRLLAFNLIYFLAILLLLAVALFVPVIIRLEGRTSSLNEQYAAATQFLLLDARLWPALALVFVLLAAHSVFISHRIAGPLFGFRRVFKALTEGNLFVRATIRRSDYLAREADAINEMITAMRKRIQGVRQECDQARAACEAVRREGQHGSRETICQGIEDLGSQLDRLQAALDQFKISEEGERATAPPPTSGPRG